jgi:RNA polymerase sigma-70 factor (ECF subfamily)
MSKGRVFDPTRPALVAVPREEGAVNLMSPRAPASADDLKLWVRALARDRDRAAFARLFDHFAPRLISYFVRAGIAREAAEEIAQDTMIVVWTKSPLYDPGQAGVATWIFTIARNMRVDRARRDSRRFAVEAHGVGAEDIASSGEDFVLADERDARVRRVIASLPADQATVVQLSFFSEKAHPAIARELGIPLGTVKSRLRLAAARIRAAWESET